MSVESERAAYDRQQKENELQRQLGSSGAGNPFNYHNQLGRSEVELSRQRWAWTREKKPKPTVTRPTGSTLRKNFIGTMSVIAFLIAMGYFNDLHPQQMFACALFGVAAAGVTAITLFLLTSPVVWGLAIIAGIVAFYLHHMH
jgi:hypothetical protein